MWIRKNKKKILHFPPWFNKSVYHVRLLWFAEENLVTMFMKYPGKHGSKCGDLPKTWVKRSLQENCRAVYIQIPDSSCASLSCSMLPSCSLRRCAGHVTVHFNVQALKTKRKKASRESSQLKLLISFLRWNSWTPFIYSIGRFWPHSKIFHFGHGSQLASEPGEILFNNNTDSHAKWLKEKKIYKDIYV